MNCFKLIPLEGEVCPFCKKAVNQLNQKDYHEQLIHALKHPLSEVRMRVIIALGLRKEKRSLYPLVFCALSHPLDVVESIEIVNSLRLIQEKHPQLQGLQTLRECHPAETVKAAAEKALEKLVEKTAP